MTTQNQVLALARSHYTGDEARFRDVLLQVIADETRKNHHQFVRDLEYVLEREQQTRGKPPEAKTMQVLQLSQSSAGLVHARQASARMSDLMLNDEQKRQITRVLDEHRATGALFDFGLGPSRKMLLTGPSGTGKTMTAEVIASELELPFFVVRLDGVIKSHLGETQSNLRAVFDMIQRNRGVYLFDEIDALTGSRSNTDDVGEMRRVVNSMLMMMDEDASKSIIIGTSNLSDLIDGAVQRRFDVIVRYHLPDPATTQALIAATLARMPCEDFDPRAVCWGAVWSLMDDGSRREPPSLSHAKLVKACVYAMRSAIISGRKSLTISLFADGIRYAMESEK